MATIAPLTETAAQADLYWTRRAHYLTHRFDLMRACREQKVTVIRAAHPEGGWHWVVIDNRGADHEVVGQFTKRADALRAAEVAFTTPLAA